MARNTSDTPSYQVWRQWNGCHADLLAKFHSIQAAKVFLGDMRRLERKRGKKCIDNEDCGGFLAYVGTIADMSPRSHYWWEVVIPDEAINSESPPIYQDILDKIAKAMREAAAAGINYEPGEDA